MPTTDDKPSVAILLVVLVALAGCEAGKARLARLFESKSDTAERSVPVRVPGEGMIANPSFQRVGKAGPAGNPFVGWSAWLWDGDGHVEVSAIGHQGGQSALLVGGAEPKLRLFQRLEQVEAGRYRVTAWVRGVDIGEGAWRQTTEFAFAGKYFRLEKNGNFGWSQLTYVAEVEQAEKMQGPSFGLMAPGMFWVDDVSVEKVGREVELTDKPTIGPEAQPLVAPEYGDRELVRCPRCQRRNLGLSDRCYACAAELPDADAANTASKAGKRLVQSFEGVGLAPNVRGGERVGVHVTHGEKALKLGEELFIWDEAQDWTGYDVLRFDTHTDAKSGVPLVVEIQDSATDGYWTRVNYQTVVVPGSATRSIQLDQLFVGEKARPGRPLRLSEITRISLANSSKGKAKDVVYIDNIRLERDQGRARLDGPGMAAFDFGTTQSPLMAGFVRVTPSTQYDPGRGFGWREAKIWRAFDVLQPEPLYQDFICLEGGSFVMDVPNGRYGVWLNVDNPSGIWGEVQTYRRRKITAEGELVVDDKMDWNAFRADYFKHWNVEDHPSRNTFDTYQRDEYGEKYFEVEVKDGRLDIEFDSSNWGLSLSAMVVFPAPQRARGQEFLNWVTERRRLMFDAAFYRQTHTPTGRPASIPGNHSAYSTFARDYMEDVYHNDGPRPQELGASVRGAAFAGELEPMTFSVQPHADLGRVEVELSALRGPGTISASNIEIGWVINRITRVQTDGSIYAIAPRTIMPGNKAPVPKGTTRRFWLTISVPENARAGIYTGSIRISPELAASSTLPVRFRVYEGTLDATDIAIGPWGHTIDMPWLPDDPATKAWNRDMARKSLQLLRRYGFTSFTGIPLRYLGFSEGKAQFDFSAADEHMKMARELGFTHPVINYSNIPGLNLYRVDKARLERSGLKNYTEFARALFTAIQAHANAHDWLPVYWNLGDEPLGGQLKTAAENAAHFDLAFPSGPPFFTAATSLTESVPHRGDRLAFIKHLDLVNLAGHDQVSVREIQKAGVDWAFYNGGGRWGWGVYLFKAVEHFGLKMALDWHWNMAAGDPYYALDTREDDYAWASASPDGQLLPSVYLERDIREGLDDYRYLRTLHRLAKERHDPRAMALITTHLQQFKLGDRDERQPFSWSEIQDFRREVAEAIEELR